MYYIFDGEIISTVSCLIINSRQEPDNPYPTDHTLTNQFRALMNLLRSQLNSTGPPLLWLDQGLDAFDSLAPSLYESRQSSLKV